MEKVINAINLSKKIAILPHKYVDGDALGSALALGISLSRQGKDVRIILEEDVPNNLSFLPGVNLTSVLSEDDYDTVLCIDTSDISRVGQRSKIFDSALSKIVIDHHATSSMHGDASYIDSNAAATGEIIWTLLKKMNIDMDKEIATCLYTAITTDTGGFRFSNTTENTHLIVADLLAKGVDCAYISSTVFDNVSKTKLFLTKQVIENMIFCLNDKVAFSYIPYNIIEKLNPNIDDYEGLTNIGRNVAGVEVSVFLRAVDENQFKGSFRSNSSVDVAAIAEKLSGGGHKKAAGFSVNGNIETAKHNIIKLLSESILV